MEPSLFERVRIAEGPNFQERVGMAVTQVCINIALEDPATPNHEFRLRFFKDSYVDPFKMAQQCAPFVVQMSDDINPDDDELVLRVDVLATYFGQAAALL